MGKTKQTANLVSNGFFTPDSDGIGIGTTNPINAALQVEGRNFAFGGPGGNESGAGNLYLGNYANPLLDSYERNIRIGSTNEIQIELYTDWDGTQYGDSVIYSSPQGMGWQFNGAKGGVSRSLYPINYSAGNALTDDRLFFQAGNKYLWFDGDTGRLGVNRSSESGWSDTLDVNGTARVTGVAKFDSNVGIGTQSPGSLVHALGSYGTVRIENSSTAQYAASGIELKGPAGDERSTKIVHGNSDAGGTETYFQIEQLNSSGSYVKTLSTYNYQYDYWGFNTGGTERLRIESDGGTIISNAGTFPSSTNETLNIQGEGHNGHGTTNTRSVFNVTGAITSNTNAAGLWIGARTNENTAVIGTRTASGNLAIETYNGGWGERLRITSDGKVGLGTDNPEEVVHILGPSEAVNDRDGVMLQHSTANADANTGLPIVWSGHIGTQTNYGLASICGRKENSNSGDAAAYLQFATCNVAGSLEEKLRLDSSGHLLGNSGARIVQEVYRAEWASTPDQRIYEMNIDNFTNSGTSNYYYFRINAWVDIGNMASPISYDVWIHKRSATAVDMNVVKLTPWHSKAIQFYHYTADSGAGDKRFVMYFGEDYSGFSIIDYTSDTGRMKTTKGRWSNTLNDSAATSAIAGYTAITVYEYSYT